MNPNLEKVQVIEDPFRRLVAIMEILRGPGGCPWDREQTHETLLPYLIEEAYEVQEDVLAGKMDSVKGELGDVALQIVFHATVAKEAGRFDIDDVMNSICEKMIRRHPHIFSDGDAKDSAQVVQKWEQIKQQEKAERGEQPNEHVSLLDGVPESLPALQRAQRLQDRAAEVGFDWDDIEQVWEKVEEEMEELRQDFTAKNEAETLDEIGDLIFALVNLARFKGVWAEMLAGKTCQKFISRFQYIEEYARKHHRHLNEMSLEEMDAIWEKAKSKEQP
ncbi:nucleoside triphosphate pyrophosphohydrolase [Candidatus Sumerlaeota bacterium]|nr:nucleoside triphosphate pyrophosphohydrolase [Candidatus Sumerlaeota bacterium]